MNREQQMRNWQKWLPAALAGQTTFWSNVLHAKHYDINKFMNERIPSNGGIPIEKTLGYCDWSLKDNIINNFSNFLVPCPGSADHLALCLQNLLAPLNKGGLKALSSKEPCYLERLSFLTYRLSVMVVVEEDAKRLLYLYLVLKTHFWVK